MDTLSLNLSRGDVAVLLRAVEQALAGCACGRVEDGRTCERCEALSAVRLDLARVVARQPARRVVRSVRWERQIGVNWSEVGTDDTGRATLADGTPLAC